MKTLNPTIYPFLLCLLFVFAGTSSLDAQIGKKLKKQLENKAVSVVDEGLNGKKEKEKEKEKVSSNEVNTGSSTARAIDKNFIDRRNLIFYDDFENEKPGEFPRKWTQINGTLENDKFTTNNREEGVVQMVSNYTTLKPTFDKDDYLGNSFKIELQTYFWNKGNEAYVLQLHGAQSSSPAYSIYLRSSNVAPGSDAVVYKAGKQSPGWSTAQLSFNQGNLKVKVDGQQLVNNPDINIRELSHVSLYTISPGSNRGDGYTKARVNYFMIAKEGLPLYDRIVTNGRIVVREIYFDVNKFEIKSNSYQALDKVVVMLKEHEDMEVTIEGHTDANGTNEDNLTLSEKRAEAVKNYLVDKGIKRYRLSSKGYGEEKPIDPADTEEAWSQNRRVEFVLASQ